MQNILVHYGEIALKGKNRPQFIQMLERNIRAALADLNLQRIEKLQGRLLLVAKDVFTQEAILRLQKIYGITHVSEVLRCLPTREAMQEVAWQLAEPLSYQTFRVSARRAFKELPYTSEQLNKEIGAYLYEKRPCKVQMKNADLEVHIEMLPHEAYVYVGKHQGPGGLPVGVSGHVLCLLSGGIDSPVAAARMQKRGCKITFVHFHSYPFQSKASQEKVRDLAQVLTRVQHQAVLYLVPFGELQREIALHAPSSLRVVLYRRFMMRLANVLARREKAKALITGESLAQVASQTLVNIASIDAASELTILRPLIGFDKQEIVNEAQRLETYAISILPDQDCCQLFMPSDPETYAQIHTLQEAEKSFNSESFCDDALARAKRLVLNAAWT